MLYIYESRTPYIHCCIIPAYVTTYNQGEEMQLQLYVHIYMCFWIHSFFQRNSLSIYSNDNYSNNIYPNNASVGVVTMVNQGVLLVDRSSWRWSQKVKSILQLSGAITHN